MTNAWEEEFRDIATERYPGSSRTRHVNRVIRPEGKSDSVEWDDAPRKFNTAEGEREFFTIGSLALALGRKSGTVRKWEREGVIPKATFRAPSGDPRGVRRLYSRDQIEGIVRIAYEEGLMNPLVQVTIASTAFTPRVIELFKELRISGSR